MTFNASQRRWPSYGDQQIAVDGVIERRGEGITFGDNQAIERQAYEQHAGAQAVE